MPTSTAAVSTQTPERYAKQLVAHLSRRVGSEPAGEGTRLLFDVGSCVVTPTSDSLRLEAFADDEPGLARVEDVVGRHLERFGQRQELVVRWARAED